MDSKEEKHCSKHASSFFILQYFIIYLFLYIFVPKECNMNRKLVIQNFGAISRADICLKKYNVFIGEQGAGKSTIAKLITIFEDYATKHRADSKPNLLPSFEEYNIASYFNKDTYIHFTWEEGSILYQDNEFALEAVGLIDGKEDAVKNLYIPAERFFVSTFSSSLATLVLNKAPIPNTLLSFASVFEKAKKKFPNYHVPIFNLLLQTDKSNETLYLKESDKTIPFKDASSGIQSVIPLLMVLDYAMEEKEFNQFVIEEPELNLFPQTQVKLLQQIIRKCPKATLTTHSPYLLAAFNNLIQASNVLRNNPDRAEDIYKIIPKECILPFEYVTAYKIENNEVISILDEEYQLIVADQIDSVADYESQIFSTLLNMES